MVQIIVGERLAFSRVDDVLDVGAIAVATAATAGFIVSRSAIVLSYRWLSLLFIIPLFGMNVKDSNTASNIFEDDEAVERKP